MKNIKILSIAILAVLCFTACEEEETFTINSANAKVAKITSPSTDSSIVLDIANPMDVATTIVWNQAVYDVPTEINYTVQLANAGTDFATPVDAGTITKSFITWTNEVLNTVITDPAGLALVPFTASDVDLRIKAFVGDNSEVTFSDPITISITPYTTELPKIAVPGDHQGTWDPPTAPLLRAAAFGETEYEGYVWLDGEHKFVAPDAAGVIDSGAGPDYGDDGSFSGILIEENEVNCNAPVAGYYLIKADTDALTYTETLHEWAVIGSGTPLGWDEDTDLTYDPATQTWSIILDLTADEIKFRSNDSWDLNYGDTGTDGLLEEGGDNIVVPVAGNYTITLDFSNARAYTYSLSLN